MTADSPTIHLNHNLQRIGSSPIRALFSLSTKPGMISFAGGKPAPELFDTEGLAASFAHVFKTAGQHAMQYGPTNGEPAMLEAAAQRLTGQGLATSAEQLTITSGSQDGIFLTAQALVNPGDVVLAENTSFVSALQAFSLVGAQVEGVSMDQAGIIPQALEAAIEEFHPVAVYLIPSFQNPTGVSMPAERRQAIADVVAAHNVVLIEDDPYAELRFTGRATTPISADHRLAQKSVHLSSLSKVLAPGLRLGWARACPELLNAIVNAKQAVNLQTSTLDQLAAAHYLTHTDLSATLLPVTQTYAERMHAMVDELKQVLPAGSVMNEPAGGMFLWVRLPDGYDAAELAYRAIDQGVVYVPGAQFYVGEPDVRTMRLSFVTNPPEVNREGVRRLAKALAQG